MRIAVGVWGSSIRFKAYQERWSGQSEYIAFIMYLLSVPEVEKVVLIGKNDGHYREVPGFINLHKIVDASGSDNQATAKYEADVAYVFQSQGAACISTIPGYRWVPNPWRRTKVLAMAANYAAPITDYLNRTNIPWIYMATDVRYIDMIKPADLTNHPKYVLSNLETKIPKWKHAISYIPYKDSKKLEYHTYTDIPVTYARLQKLNLFFNAEQAQTRTRITRFAMVCNKILDFKYRSLEVKKWVPKDCYLYGNLEVPGFNNQFVPSDQLDTVFSRVKYTLVMPLYNHGHGKEWLTFKPYEMIRQGVVPFVHPDYDHQFRFASPDDFLRVSSPDELHEKMDYLDKNDKKRRELISELSKKLVPPNDLIKYAKNLI